MPPKRSPANQRRLSVIPARPVKETKSQHLTNFDRLRIIDIYRSLPPGTTCTRAIPAIHEFGYTTMVTSTLTRLLHAESAIREYVAADPGRLYEKRRPNLKLPEVDAATAQWVIQTLSSPRARLSGEMIREKACQFCRLMGFPDNIVTFSNGWLRSFKVRMGLAHYVFHGEAASAPIERISDERYRLVSMIQWYTACNVYNCDETALPWCLVPANGLAFGSMPGIKLDKKRLSYLLCTNMDGSDKRTPLTIGRARKPHCFGTYTVREHGFYYYWNDNAWMVHSIWKEYLSHLNEDMRRQNRYILLLCDNAPSHKHDDDAYSNVRVERMLPNTTAWLQPLDGGIIASFKAHYRRYFVRHALYLNEQGVSAENMYKVNQLDGMKMALAAWSAVTPQTIYNCWRHVGLVPSALPVDGPQPPAPYQFPQQASMHEYIELIQHMQDYYDPMAYLSPEEITALGQFETRFVTEGTWSDEQIVALYHRSS